MVQDNFGLLVSSISNTTITMKAKRRRESSARTRELHLHASLLMTRDVLTLEVQMLVSINGTATHVKALTASMTKVSSELFFGKRVKSTQVVKTEK